MLARLRSFVDVVLRRDRFERQMRDEMLLRATDRLIESRHDAKW